MNIYKSIKRFLRLMKNRKTMLVLCVILFLPILAACLGTEPAETDAINNESQLSEAEPVKVYEDNIEWPIETEISPTQEAVEEMKKLLFGQVRMEMVKFT